MEPDAVSVAAYGAANGSCAAPSPSPYYSSASAPACATFRAPPAPPPSIAQPSGLASAAPSVPLSPTPQGHLGGHLGTFSGHRSNRLLVPITPLNRPYTSGSLEWQFLHAAEVGDKPLMARVLLERERERASALAARAAAAAVSSPEEGGENEREELEPQSSLNINCTDILGRSALVIAVDNENVEMVELLLRQRGLQLGDALLYAIKEVRAPPRPVPPSSPYRYPDLSVSTRRARTASSRCCSRTRRARTRCSAPAGERAARRVTRPTARPSRATSLYSSNRYVRQPQDGDGHTQEVHARSPSCWRQCATSSRSCSCCCRAARASRSRTRCRARARSARCSSRTTRCATRRCASTRTARWPRRRGSRSPPPTRSSPRSSSATNSTASPARRPSSRR